MKKNATIKKPALIVRKERIRVLTPNELARAVGGMAVPDSESCHCQSAKVITCA